MAGCPASWDWYSATVFGPSGAAVVARLRAELPDVARVEPGRSSQPGYERQDRAVDGCDRPVFTVFSGGHNQHPHVRTTGQRARGVVPVLRSLFPDHSVSRCDSAIDLVGEGCFDTVTAHGLELARRSGLKWSVRGDWRELPEREPSGRTFYLGSRQSLAFVRCYEKGLHELSSWHGGPDEDRPSPHWVRAEVELKPQKRDARLKASRLSELEVWGCSAASRDMLRRVSSLDVEKVVMREHRETSARRTIRYVAAQYGSAFLELCDELGEAGALEFFLTAIEDARRARDAA